MTKQAEKLLIIGNGFDLSLQLQTSYNSFFTERYSDLMQQEVSDFKGNRKTDLAVLKTLNNKNFWDIYFLLKHDDERNVDKNWSNIESDIESFLTGLKPDGKKEMFTIDNCKAVYKKNLDGKEYSKIDNAYISILLGVALLDIPRELNQFDDFIFSELKKFENSFKEYINEILKRRKSYTRQSKHLIENLVENTDNLYILSFNYTEFRYELSCDKQIEGENVHGKIREEIIFGIDAGNLDVNGEAYRYSKTYRKLMMNFNGDEHSSLPKEIKKIIFYGHSLADADYSYFQSIFDFYSIYDSEIGVEFCFNVFNPELEQDIERDQLKSVTRLLNKYGGSMTNLNHGKNLTHKLLLENRLRISKVRNNGSRV